MGAERFILIPSAKSTAPQSAAPLDALPADVVRVERGSGAKDTVVDVPAAQVEQVRAELERSGYSLVPDRVIKLPPMPPPMSLPPGPAPSTGVKLRSSATSCSLADPRGFDAQVIGSKSLQERGYTGKGVHAFVIDSGIGPNCLFQDKIGDGVDLLSPERDPSDTHGHGTAAASKINEMAPDAILHPVRVIDENGHTPTSRMLDALEWIERWLETNKPELPVVVNLSIAGDALPTGLDPMLSAMRGLQQRQPVLFIVAAGNEGAKGENTIGTPGTSPDALTVAASYTSGTVSLDDDGRAPFSSRGGSDAWRGQASKPNVIAPGQQVAVLLPGDQASLASGTSFATPSTAGGAIQLLQVVHELYQQGAIDRSPAELVQSGSFVNTMATSSDPLANLGADEQGSGHINLVKAEAVFREGKAPQAVPQQKLGFFGASGRSSLFGK